MKPEDREKRVTEIMTKIVNNLHKEGPLSLGTIAEPYRTNNEMGLCLMAFSKLEAEDIIVKDSDGKWKFEKK